NQQIVNIQKICIHLKMQFSFEKKELAAHFIIIAFFRTQFRIDYSHRRQCFLNGRIIKSTTEVEIGTYIFCNLVQQIYIWSKNGVEVAICILVGFALIEPVLKTIVCFIEIQTKLACKIFGKR